MNSKVPGLPKKRKAPHKLFDFLIANYELKNDNALANELEITPSLICKIRYGRPITATLILKVHERWDIPVKEIKSMLPEAA